jgi:ABC-type multidrug transport system fused ATPase/permease subunit
MLDALVSLTRVQDYLNSSDRCQTTIPGDNIQFRDAKIGWPADNQNFADPFTLNADKIDFPTGELSIISGPTGSGKNLLLAAIIREADVLSGVVTVPQMELPGNQNFQVPSSE